jgi:hypothetical protein
MGAKTTMTTHKDQQMASKPFPPSNPMKNNAFAAFFQWKGDKTFHLQEIAPILKWQRDVKGESAKICEFKEAALQNKMLTAFHVIMLEDPTIKVLHGHMRYSTPMATASL